MEGLLAQLVEHDTFNVGVASSSLAGVTNKWGYGPVGLSRHPYKMGISSVRFRLAPQIRIRYPVQKI